MKYTKPLWAVTQTFRETGLLEDVCKHNIGHPNQEWLELRWLFYPEQKHWAIHGCDGCCYSGEEINK